MVSHQYRYIFGDESGDAGFAIDKGSSNPAAFRWAGGNRLIRLFHRHHTTIMLYQTPGDPYEIPHPKPRRNCWPIWLRT